MAASERAAWRISGRVQGVGFRWYTVQEARELGVEGRVWNRPDGTVEVQARGSPGALAALRRWLQTGPPAARVTAVVSVRVGPPADADGFRVWRDPEMFDGALPDGGDGS